MSPGDCQGCTAVAAHLAGEDRLQKDSPEVREFWSLVVLQVCELPEGTTDDISLLGSIPDDPEMGLLGRE